MDLTPKQQTSEAIRQAETILITTGQHPSVDQAAAVLALTSVLRKLGKKVNPVMSEGLPAALAGLSPVGVERNLSGLRDFILKLDVSKAEVDKLRYEVLDNKLQIFVTPFKGGFASGDVTFDYGDYRYDLAIILGVPTRARIDRVYEQHEPLFQSMPVLNLDYHRSNENYGAVNYIEPTASSLCEMLVALSESLQTGLVDGDIATVMLAGLMASTDRFTASHTTSKSLTVAAQMMAAGARQPAVVRALYRERPAGRFDERPRTESRVTADTRPARLSEARPAASSPTKVEPEVPKAEPAQIDSAKEDTKTAVKDDVKAEVDKNTEVRIEAREPEVEILPPAHIEPSIETEALPTMADFAAAAEVLTERDKTKGNSEPEA